jgi:hypothetical protein
MAMLACDSVNQMARGFGLFGMSVNVSLSMNVENKVGHANTPNKPGIIKNPKNAHTTVIILSKTRPSVSSSGNRIAPSIAYALITKSQRLLLTASIHSPDLPWQR